MHRFIYGILLLVLFLPASAQENFQQKELHFIENKGQLRDTDGRPCPEIAYYLRSASVDIYFSRNRISYVFRKDIPVQELTAIKNLSREISRSVSDSGLSYRLDVELSGADPGAQIVAGDEDNGKYYFYSGYDPKPLEARSFRKLSVRSIYDRTDLVFYSSGRRLKYDFVVHPGGDPSRIALRYTGAAETRVLPSGEAEISHPLGTLREGRPLSFVSDRDAASLLGSAADAVPVETSYRLRGNTLGFRLGTYDRKSTLVIDPEVVWSTYYGDEDAPGTAETPVAMTLDSAGDVYITGSIGSGKIPATVGNIYSGAVRDAFVMKFSGAGVFRWFTYLGGTDSIPSRNLNFATGIASDGKDCFITGWTDSKNFPVTPGAFQTTYKGAPVLFGQRYGDCFIARLSSEGQLVWSSYLGGPGGELSGGICIDREKDLIVTGTTFFETGFPVTLPVDLRYDGFIAKFSSDGMLKWSRYYRSSIRVCTDSKNNIYVPTDDNVNGYNVQVRVTKFRPGGDFAGQNSVQGWKKKPDLVPVNQWIKEGVTRAITIAADPYDFIVVGGSTDCDTLFNLTDDALQKELGGDVDGFIAKLDMRDSSLQPAPVYCSFLGGAAEDYITSVAADSTGNIYLAGPTYRTQPDPKPFPLFNPLDNSAEALESFVVVLGRDNLPIWSTYWGGTGHDNATAMAVSRDDEVIIAGITTSRDFFTKNAEQEQRSGDDSSPLDMFITKFRCIKPLDFRISSADTIFLCESSDTVLTAADGFAEYQWSDGSKSRSLLVNSNGDYEVTGFNRIGCMGRSNRVTVRVIPTLSVQSTFEDGILDAYTNLVACDSIEIQNRSEKTFIIGYEDFRLSSNIEFSLPLHQFPVILPPFSTRKITACLFTPDIGRYRDTITLYPDDPCTAAIPVAGLTRDPDFSAETSCNAIVKIRRARPDEIPLDMAPSFPNPADGMVSVPVFAGKESSASVQCELLNALGETVALARLSSERLFAVLTEKVFLFDTSLLPSGLYFCRVSDGGDILMQSLVISH